MAIEYDDGWDGDYCTWRCTECDAEMDQFHEICPECGARG